MDEISIRVAGQNIRIVSEYRISANMYADFRTDAATDLCVQITDEDIDFIHIEEFNTRKMTIKTPKILIKMAETLLPFDILLMHGAVIEFNKQAYMFSATSGTGKTTHVLKWLNNCPDAIIINGDKPFIKLYENDCRPLACGSPWAGKENMYTNSMTPLKSIILMERAENNHIEQISFSQAFPSLLQQTYRPNDEVKMRKTLRLLQRLNPSVTFWRFQCNNFKDDCFAVAYNALVRGQA